MTQGSGAKGDSLSIWILQTGEPLHIDSGDPRPMRAMNVANSLTAAGHKITVWSSSFSHQHKQHRSDQARSITVSSDLEYRLIDSPGYERNIGFGRLWDHAVLARNLRQMLRHERNIPDACFIGYPPIETAAVMARWAKTRRVPTLMDVKDQWPAMFLAGVPQPLSVLGRFLLSPYFVLAKRAMRDATGISAMAEGFLEWALQFAGRSRSSLDAVVPLTSPTYELSTNELREARDWWAARGVADDGRIRFCFIGSHTRSFDFTPVVAAAKRLAADNIPCDLIICGTGEQSADWKRSAAGLPNVMFPGWVTPAQVRALAELASGFLAPYIGSDDFERSVPNKVVDAFSLGLPVVTSLRGEVASLIDQYDVGLRYGSDTGRTLFDCLLGLIENQELRRRMSSYALDLHRERFSYEKVYGDLVTHLERLVVTGPGRV